MWCWSYLAFPDEYKFLAGEITKKTNYKLNRSLSILTKLWVFSLRDLLHPSGTPCQPTPIEADLFLYPMAMFFKDQIAKVRSDSSLVGWTGPDLIIAKTTLKYHKGSSIIKKLFTALNQFLEINTRGLEAARFPQKWFIIVEQLETNSTTDTNRDLVITTIL